MNRPVKLADVAKAAGVSQGTASNAFGRPELVRAEVRERILAAADRLGYHGPDPRGRLLRAGKVHSIGVVVMDNLVYFFSDPFNRELMRGVAEVCEAEGAGISLISAADQKTAAWSIESAVVDGFIVQCLEEGDRLVEVTRRRNLPFVAIDHDPGPTASSILIDERNGGRAAAQHLVDLGHRRFAVMALELIGDGHVGLVDRERRLAAQYASTRDRLLGYEDALATVGIAIDDVPIVESLNDRKAAHTAAALLDAAPDATAVLAMSDVLALAVLDEAAKRGIRVPHDLSVVGFDDVPEAAAADPPLTTVRQPIIEKGRLAAKMILSGGPPRRELLPVSLVVRGSTAAPPHRPA